jgi:hypothetical protein
MCRLRRLRLLLGAVLALGLGGCWGGSSAPPPRQSVVSHFVAGAPGTIETVIVDPLPVKAARLLRPQGPAIEAARIDRDRNVYAEDTGYGPGVAIGAEGGSQSRVSTGIGFAFPLFGGGGSGVRTTAMTTSTLRFQVPDMAAYRRGWQGWTLQLELDDGASRRTIETLPPAPPPE